MKTKLITLFLCLCPLLLIAQDYKKEGDELFQQAQYEKAIKKYNAYIAFAGKDPAVSKRIANAQKLISLLSRAKSAEQAAAESSSYEKYEEAGSLYNELYSLHSLSSYKSKATQLQKKADAIRASILEEQERAERERIAQEEAKRKEREERERKAKEEAEERAKHAAEQYARENPAIPEGTTEIPANAYKGKNIRSITIPNSVTRIGSNAFEGCTKLRSVTIPDGVVAIEDGAFARCTTLSSVNIGNRVKSIGDNAFANCKLLTSIGLPNSISTIGRNAFGGCVNLSEIVIGSRVTSLGYGTFDGCLNLKAINVSEDNKSYSSYDGVLYNKDKTILIRCPQGKKEIVRIQVTVRVIDDDAFKGCSYVRYITIPKSVKSIGEHAFMRCKNLEISIPRKWKDKVDLSGCKSVKYY